MAIELVEKTQRSDAEVVPEETAEAGTGTPTGTGEGTGAEAEGAGKGEGAEGTGADAAGELGADGEPVARATKETVPLSTFLETKRTLKETIKRLDDLTSTMTRIGESTEERFRRVEPPAKDSLDDWQDSLPDGKPPVEEGQQGDAAYERKRDVAALVPLLKDARTHLLAPMTRRYEPVMAGVLQALDRLRFITGQIEESFVTKDEQGNITEDRRPLGLKHMDRIDAVRRESLEKSGGRSILRHQDSFDQVLAQVKGEDGKKAKDAERLRTEGADEALRRDKERTRAAGAPGSVAGTAPRGTVTPGRRTFAQIEKDRISGKDFKIG